MYTSECKALSGEPEEASRANCLSDACIKQYADCSLVLSLLCTLASTNWVSLAAFLCCLVLFPLVQLPSYVYSTVR